MKYSFVKKGKVPDPAQIKSTMNFGKVAANSKAFVGAKVTSSILKGATAVKTAVVSTASVAVVATSTYVVYPEIFENSSNQDLEPAKIELQQEDILPDSITQVEVIPVDTAQLIEEPEVKEDSVISTPKPVLKKQEPAPILLLSEDVIVEALPLPDLSSFHNHINDNLSYPVQHLHDSIEGFVKVRFKINKKGLTEDFKISKSLGEAFDNEAIRVIRAYKQWQPATYNGEAVDSYKHFKVIFKLK